MTDSKYIKEPFYTKGYNQGKSDTLQKVMDIIKDEFAFSICDQSEECQEHKKELERKLKELSAQ